MATATAMLPELFPLSEPMLLRLAQDRGLLPKQAHKRSTPLTPPTASQWASLAHEVQGLRKVACIILKPTNHVSDDEIVEKLQQADAIKKAFSNKDFSSLRSLS